MEIPQTKGQPICCVRRRCRSTPTRVAKAKLHTNPPICIAQPSIGLIIFQFILLGKTENPTHKLKAQDLSLLTAPLRWPPPWPPQRPAGPNFDTSLAQYCCIWCGCGNFGNHGSCQNQKIDLIPYIVVYI